MARQPAQNILDINTDDSVWHDEADANGEVMQLLVFAFGGFGFCLFSIINMNQLTFLGCPFTYKLFKKMKNDCDAEKNEHIWLKTCVN